MTKNTIPVHVGGRTTSALIDSGASVTIINKEFFKKTHYASHQLSPPAFQSVKGASGKLLPVLGQIQLEITYYQWEGILIQNSCCRRHSSCIHFRG